MLRRLATARGRTLVTFRLPAYVAAADAFVVGDFNDWSSTATPMGRDDSGWCADVMLATRALLPVPLPARRASGGSTTGMPTTTERTSTAARTPSSICVEQCLPRSSARGAPDERELHVRRRPLPLPPHHPPTRRRCDRRRRRRARLRRRAGGGEDPADPHRGRGSPRRGDGPRRGHLHRLVRRADDAPGPEHVVRARRPVHHRRAFVGVSAGCWRSSGSTASSTSEQPGRTADGQGGRRTQVMSRRAVSRTPRNPNTST